MQHKHKEAFCHMQYMGTSRAGRIILTIWNSRDGVTPFLTFCKDYSIELQHVNFQQDRYDPDYKPKKGDLIWRDLRQEELVESVEYRFDQMLKDEKALESLSEKQISEKYGYDVRKYMQSMIAAGREKWIDSIIELAQPGQPKLELVTEDWK